jgi:hypothetical protein
MGRLRGSGLRVEQEDAGRRGKNLLFGRPRPNGIRLQNRSTAVRGNIAGHRFNRD